MEKVIEEMNQELESKNFTSIKVESSNFENTVQVVINSIKSNKYGASIKSVKYMEQIDNIGHWNEEGKSEWYSHTSLCGCSQSAISWLISKAKEHKELDFDLIINFI